MDSFTKIKTMIVDIETNFDVSKLNSRGFNFWPIIRKQIQGDVSYSRSNQPYVITKPKDRVEIVVYDILKLLYYFSLVFLRRSAYVVQGEIAFNGYPVSQYKVKIGNKYFNQYIDPYFEYIKRFFKTEKVLLQSSVLKQENEMLYPCQVIDDTLLIKYFFLKDKVLRSRDLLFEDFSEIKDLVEEINNFCLQRYDYLPINSGTLSHIDTVSTYMKIYDFIFKKSNFKVFMFECGYDNQNFGAILAGKKRKIKTIEIQHGVIEDAVYGPYTRKVNYEILPDYLWTWSERDANCISKNNFGFTNLYRPLPLGNLWVSKCVNDMLPSEMQYTFGEIRKEYEKIIVITLQPSFMLSHELVNFIHEAKDFYFVIKSHPNSTAEETSSLQKMFESSPHVDFKISSKLGLISIFRFADFHITHSSASALEALSVGVKTIIYDSYGNSFFSEYISAGVMYYCEKKTEINHTIRSVTSQRADKNDYYSILPHEETVLEEVKKILDESK